MTEKSVIGLTGKGWTHVQLRDVIKLQKSWVFEEQEYRVGAYFGKLCDGPETPVVIMNVYIQGAGAKQVIDDNCDVWNNILPQLTRKRVMSISNI